MSDISRVFSNGKAIIPYVAAGDPDVNSTVRFVLALEKAGADIIELNMCCPNMSFNLQLSQGDDNASKIKTGDSIEPPVCNI